MALKLVSVHLPSDKPPELRLLRTINCVKPVQAMYEWTVRVNGPAVILISPAKDKDGKPAATRTMYEFARSACVLEWSTGDVDDADKVQKHNTPPMTREAHQDAAADDVDAKPAAKAVAK